MFFLKKVGVKMYNKQLKFRADEEIRNKLLLKSKLLNISYAEYLRLLILDDEKRNFIGEIIEFKNVLRELKIELNYIGNNLNQLSKKVNSNANVQLDEVLKVQENLSNILQKLGGYKNASINENSREQEKE